ncbi:Leucine Rich repeats (2 copies) [Symmachiella dynata]|uniref:Leucine Rich repeats (2 copies) n=1 Tax=Symmachiella dynata TaxID=2527995 RepID=A0A517ZQA9_9PLAN|nr:hypothetical protein [Symmachiella dynata]QDU44664.1 Leucine Rich repeats (2 copies) [Symmachiella dynata]
MTDSAPKSRLPRTGTLVLIAVVLLISGGALMVWLPYHRNQTVIAEVRMLGGETQSQIIRPFWIPDAVDDEYLGAFERVLTVDLAGTQVSDAGLKHLQGLTKLYVLSLGTTHVSDVELEHFRELTNLYDLRLSNTQVSDAGLEHLQGLTNLEVLDLDNTRVTQAGIDKLQKALPDCRIIWTPPAE